MKAALSLILLLAASCACATSLTVTDDGIRMDAGTMGIFTLSYPTLDTGAGEPIKPIEKRVTDRRAVLRYPGDTQGEVALGPDGAITVAFTNPPAGMRAWRMEMLIDFSYREGGRWRVGGDDAKPFPQEKPARPQFFQGTVNRLALTNQEGKTLLFELPDGTFQQLQDNREWNWKIYHWLIVVPFQVAGAQATIKVREESAGTRPPVVVDRFGQDAALEFPGKVKSVEELKGDVARDTAYYAAVRPPARDSYGGLPDSGPRLGLRKTGFFHVEQKGGRWWLTDPEGNACFHLGLCGFQPGDDYTYIKGREASYEWLPPYESEFQPAFHPESYWSRDTFSFYLANLIRKYGRYDPGAFQARMVERVRRFGFNAAGAFTGDSPARKAAHFPYAAMLPLGIPPIEGLRGIFDPFEPGLEARLDASFAREVAPRANDPLLVGYFMENEQAFEDIPRVIPGLKGAAAAKRHLVAMLRARYKTIGAFNRAWALNADGFDALADRGLPVATREASADMAAYTQEFLTAYYGTINRAFRRADRNHMLLGSRWQPGTANNEALCRAAGRVCEILSVNYYTYGVDRAFLKRLHAWSGGRPFLLSEFYWTAPKESGLPGGSELKTQKERGLAYRNYVEQAASTGFVVGIEWFLLLDQARTGRFFERYTGERANTGLFSVTDRPYKDFLAQATLTNREIYDVLLGKRPAFAWNDPRFAARGVGPRTITIPRAVGPIRLDGTRAGWPGNPPETVSGSRLVIGADPAGLEGVFRLCWDDASLYMLAQITDSTPMRNDRQGGEIWNGDGIELFIGPEEPDRDGPLLFSDRQALLSGGQPPDGVRGYLAHSPAQMKVPVVVLPDGNGRGYTLEAAIPFKALGFTPKEGQVWRFDLAIDDGDGMGRQRQLMWSGGARNSADRTGWGRARLMR